MKIAQKLLIAATVTSTIFLAELIGGLLFGSLSLVADSFHVILDVAALLFSFAALRLALRESNDQYTFGYHRLEIFAALINGILLSLAIIYIVYESIQRLITPIQLIPLNILIIAVIGLGANLISIKLIGHQHDQDVNIKSAYLHILGDTLASIAVIIGAIFILFWSIYWLDPIIALFIAIILVRGTYRVLKESLFTLMQKSPLDTKDVINWLGTHPEIIDTHDLHIWRLCSNILVLSCHIVVKNAEFKDLCKFRENLNLEISQKFNIQHSTIQIELESEQCNCDLRHKEHTPGEGFTCPVN